jgi:hypothetical protein
MAKLAVLQNQSRVPDSQVWHWLVDYANDNNSPKDFRNLVRAGFLRMGIAEGVPEILRKCKDMQTEKSMHDLEEDYRERIRGVFRWIVAPTDPLGLDAEAAKFLVDCVQSAKIGILISVTITPTGATTFKHNRAFTESGSIIAGVCHFLLRQIDRHDLDGERLVKVFPVAICKREECGRFRVVQRAGRAQFCSDSCKSKANASKKTKKQLAKKMRDYRSRLKKREADGLAAVLTRGTKKGGK